MGDRRTGWRGILSVPLLGVHWLDETALDVVVYKKQTILIFYFHLASVVVVFRTVAIRVKNLPVERKKEKHLCYDPHPKSHLTIFHFCLIS